MNVTDWPMAGALAELDTEIEGAALPTVTVMMPDAAAALLPSPP